MECADCEMHGVAAIECIAERMSEQVSRESCSELRSDMHSVVAVPRSSRCAHSMRRPPRGGRRTECANRETVCAAAS
eukprot:11182486-Lingulodinium_polyedra.AAC.1